MKKETKKKSAGKEKYIDRDLSWLEFNKRVLDEAEDPATPILEKLKFTAIFSSNLDEFVMVRMAALAGKLSSGQMDMPENTNAEKMKKSPAGKLIKKITNIISLGCKVCGHLLIPKLIDLT